VTRQQLTAVVGRALTEALQDFEPEKTLWLAPAKASVRIAADRDVPGAPISNSIPKKSSKRNDSKGVENAEQLRAFLWDAPLDSPFMPGDAVAIDNIPTLVPPPRSIPGATPPLPALKIGAIVKNRYRLESHLGYGGIGQVYTATDLEAERQGNRESRVTIKVVAVDLQREPQALTAMKIAVAKIKDLRHPNVVTTYSVEGDNDRLFVTMEPLAGRWLGERIRAVRGSGVPSQVAWPIVEGIASGLAYAHRRGIVHSDLSPYTVFVSGNGTPKIMGFGLIHALPTSNEALDLLDTMTLRAYSEAYAANAWATHARPHPSDDLYPLGVIAYELLTGLHPFQRSNLMTARQKNLSLAPIPGLNRRAAKLIEHCLAFEREARPNDAEGFLARLNGPVWMQSLFGDRFAIRNA